MIKLHKSEAGIAHLALFLVVLMLVGVGGASYLVYNRSSDQSASISSDDDIDDSLLDDGSDVDGEPENDKPTEKEG